MTGEEMEGSFCEPEMVLNDTDIYGIERILKKRQYGKLIVKWKGFTKPSIMVK